jgi:CheY-like chemotaxis protein
MKTLHQNGCRRILIIDDQNSIHDVFRSVLLRPAINNGVLNDLESELFGPPSTMGNDDASTENVSHVVEFAHQGEEGCLKLQAALERGEHFDLAFVDMQMPPGWNGIETIHQLWALMPSLPVVVCTAYSKYSWISICKLLGNTEQLNLLPKPFVAAEVHEIINNAFRQVNETLYSEPGPCIC